MLGDIIADSRATSPGIRTNEAAWREDNRRKPNGTNWNAVIDAALAGPKSPVWTGYWHRSAS